MEGEDGKHCVLFIRSWICLGSPCSGVHGAPVRLEDDQQFKKIVELLEVVTLRSKLAEFDEDLRDSQPSDSNFFIREALSEEDLVIPADQLKQLECLQCIFYCALFLIRC